MQKVADQGVEDDLSTWQYFGLVTTDGTDCVLDDEAWKPLGSRQSRIWGKAEIADQTLQKMATSIISKFGTYEAMRNNCQDFAIELFLAAVYVIENSGELLNMLSQFRGSPLLNMTESIAGIRKPLVGLEVETIQLPVPEAKRGDAVHIIEVLCVTNRKGEVIYKEKLSDHHEFEDIDDGVEHDLWGLDKFTHKGIGMKFPP